VNKIEVIFGSLVLLAALAAAPIPLIVGLQSPPRNVVIYPNVLFTVPLILLGVLLLLYGSTAGK
jgi:hypothetical protein